MKFLFQSIAEGSCLLNLKARSIGEIVGEAVDFLVQTGRLAGSQRDTVLDGLIGDIRRRIPYYVNDFRAGMKAKSIASIVFMFFACLAPAVTFGGLMGLETAGAIGAPEMLMSTAFCGIAYAMLSGQPLIILGGIGPLLIFTIILYQLCRDLGYSEQFLGVYGWVGLWTALMTVMLSVFNASNLMRFFTRLTDEIFSALMSLIFVYKAIQALAIEFQADEAVSHEKALLALVLAVGTFYIAMTLARIRSSRSLLPWIREFWPTSDLPSRWSS